MNKHFKFSEISILDDNKWVLCPINHAKEVGAKFQAEDGYSYVVELIPRSDWKGLLFGSLVSPQKRIRIVNGKSGGRKWLRLFSFFQRLGNNISIVLVKTARRDVWEKYVYSYWKDNNNFAAVYTLTVESEIDPDKFVRFLSQPGNKERIGIIVEGEINRLITEMVGRGEDIHNIIEGGELNHNILEEAGYSIKGFNLFYRNEFSVKSYVK